MECSVCSEDIDGDDVTLLLEDAAVDPGAFDTLVCFDCAALAVEWGLQDEPTDEVEDEQDLCAICREPSAVGYLLLGFDGTPFDCCEDCYTQVGALLMSGMGVELYAAPDYDEDDATPWDEFDSTEAWVDYHGERSITGDGFRWGKSDDGSWFDRDAVACMDCGARVYVLDAMFEADGDGVLCNDCFALEMSTGDAGELVVDIEAVGAVLREFVVDDDDMGSSLVLCAMCGEVPVFYNNLDQHPDDVVCSTCYLEGASYCDQCGGPVDLSSGLGYATSEDGGVVCSDCSSWCACRVCGETLDPDVLAYQSMNLPEGVSADPICDSCVGEGEPVSADEGEVEEDEPDICGLCFEEGATDWWIVDPEGVSYDLCDSCYVAVLDMLDEFGQEVNASPRTAIPDDLSGLNWEDDV